MNSSKTVRLVSASREVSEIVKAFDDYVSQHHPVFKMACIHQLGIDNISNDPSKEEFYPLKIYADIIKGDGSKENVEIYVSEVRCGYRGESSEALISILEKTRLPFKETDKLKIFTSRRLNLTIFDRTIMKAY